MAVLSALAVPAFLLGAAIAEPPSGARDAARAERAPGHAAFDAGTSASAAVSPAGESRARDATVPAATPPLRSGGGAAAGLTVRIVVPAGPFTSDELVRFRVRWSDGSGRYAGLTESWGDGTAASSAEVVSCTGGPGAHADELTTAHRFPAGRFRVRVTVTTADCRGRTEERTAEVTIQVDAPSDEPESGQETSAPAPPTPSSEAPSPSAEASSGVPLPLPTVEPLVSP
ncbi:hypothetical protein [Cryptosporangium arvum]|uniref:hypothetical protein n=1 Tax=Cryptosporangium arvum TaxID=80871 RepID=UPI0012EE034E|nr:hypothetical protein [Cryptosporangium arvum]